MKKPDFQTRASKKKEAFKENIFRNSITWGFCFCLMYFSGILLKLKGPQSADILTLTTLINNGIAMLICTILLVIINYNVRQKRIFVQANANLMKAIGHVLWISGCTPIILYYLFNIPVQFSLFTTPDKYLIFIGFFVLEIGYILQKAVKIKEEQDLTI